jgi:predicted house-cleaning noncanonical NTP pyrophosphatase (MazG superfamily)
MTKFLKFTEICSSSGRYCASKEKVISEYFLRETHVNLDNIILFAENEELNELSSRQEIITGLETSAGFTRIVLSYGTQAKQINVVGSPLLVGSKIREVTRNE